jgi:hypothetical protein
MSKLEEARQKRIETGAALREIATERKALPEQIAAAAESGDRETLAKLSARKIAIEAEYVAANIADKRAQISCFEAERDEALAHATELTNALPAEKQRLADERQDLQRRLEQNNRDSINIEHEETKARGVVDELRAKIEGARQALSRYVKESAELAAA